MLPAFVFAAVGAMPATALHSVTPLVRSSPLSAAMGREVFLKLECLQPSGSFKLRGIGHVVQRAYDDGARAVVSSSGGNAGLATAYAAQKLGLDCVVVLPTTTPDEVRRNLEDLYGARVVVSGGVWDEANVEAERLAREMSARLVHPFDDPIAWEGHATMVAEISEQLGESRSADCFVTSVGGGGLLMGILKGIELHAPSTKRVVAVETDGADCFDRSFRAGAPVTLSGITSIAKTLGATTPSATVLAAALESGIVKTKVVSDADAVAACVAFANERRHLVEPACGASLATVYNPRHRDLFLDDDDNIRTIVVVVCGGAVVDLPALSSWAKNLGVDLEQPSRDV